ncbi:S1 RNA-binding domain-containing protein [Patescibacteria group bacterium]|nr:MAG: S1 RNA-binding domain-containing protein [Patescibacteria group bacterium]
MSDDFKNLVMAHTANIPKAGDVIKGKIISVEKGQIQLDVQGLTVGVVRGRELFAESREYGNLKVGDEVEATVMELENENGEMELSFRVAGYQRAWDNVKKWMNEGLAVKGKALSANKGGLMMQVGALAGFMPVSQLSPEHYPRVAGGDKGRILEKLRELINKELEIKVIDADEKEEKLIVSEKAVWEDAQKAVLESYKIGDLVEGEVSALTSFGAFVRFGNDLEGLVHISEIAWQRIDHPKDILKVGDKIKAQIIQLDRSKIYLSIKRLVDDPWKSVKEKYKMGDKVSGKILKVEPFGLMVALDKEIHGLAHISELADESIANINDKFKVGETKEFEIVSLEPMEHRLGLRAAGVKGKSARKAEEKKEEKPASAEATAAKAEEAKPAEEIQPEGQSQETADAAEKKE